MLNGKKLIIAIALPALFVGSVVGCQEGPAERAGERMDRAVDRAGDSVERAGDRARDRTDR